MRPQIAAVAFASALAALGCSGSPSGPQTTLSGPASSASSSSSTLSSSSSSSSSSSTASSSTATSSSSSSSRANNASSGGASSSNGCGADTCSACPQGYASADHCVDGSWQCACAKGSGSSSVSNSSSGSSTSANCGPNNCGGCSAPCVAADTCEPGGWLCSCACGGNSSSSSSGSSGASGGASGSSSGGTPCPLDGGTPEFPGSWNGTTSVSEMFGIAGGGGAGPDSAIVVDIDGGIEFEAFGSVELPNCVLPFTLTGPTSANVVAGSTCVDSSNGQWTFQSGTATLNASGCVMTVTTSGTVVDPGMGAGTFTTSSTLDLQ